MSPTLFDDQPAPGGSRGSGNSGSGGTDTPAAGTPLAERLRPRSLAEVLGQEDVVGEDGFLARAIASDRVPSLIFWGPPGSGKTTLARLLAQGTAAHFVPFSAVTSGIKEVKAVMADAERLRRATGQRTLLFVDEIHRFNRAQQDAFLPYVESGDIVLVGATTENPSFELNGALLSRCRVVVLKPLAPEELVALARRALEDEDRGLGELKVEADPEALEELAQLAGGDGRKLLSLLELAALDAAEGDPAEEAKGKDESPENAPRLTADHIRRVAQGKVLLYDKSGEEHFNLISALHKSIRESDPDAALYWLARMLASGEDPLYLARRMTRIAAEDIGLADPSALQRALTAWDVYHRLGSPEGELALAQLALYLALAPKSDGVYRAYKAARRTVETRPADPVPHHLRNAPTRMMKDLGYGEGYVYAHGEEEGVGGIDCLPESLVGTRFYEPKGEGFEGRLLERMERFRELRERVRRGRKG